MGDGADECRANPVGPGPRTAHRPFPRRAANDPEETFPGAVTGASDCFKSSAVWVVGDGTKEAFRGRAAGVSDYFTSQSELEAGIGTKPP